MISSHFVPIRSFSVRWLVVSLLALLLVPNTPAQTTIFSEDFENGLTGWQVGDNDIQGPAPSYWGIVDLAFGGEGQATPGGSFKAYCAGVGYVDSSTSPNYQSYMAAYLQRTIDLTGQASATLSFWYKIPSIETGYDYAQVLMDDTLLWTRDTPQAGVWAKVVLSLEAFVGGQHTLKFVFVSDDRIEDEGWYLDDILVTDAFTAGPAPDNDNFANAEVLVGAIGTINGINSSSSFEANEPANGFPATNSVWFRWTPTTNGSVTFRTGSSTFDTVLCVYTGNNVAALAPVQCDTNGDTNGASLVSFNAVQGTIYRIQIRGANSASGLFTLNWNQPDGVGIDLLPDVGLWADEGRGYLYDWYIDKNERPGRILLRASTASINTGAGPLELIGSSSAPGVYQRIYRSDGSSRDVYAGTFTFHTNHQHLHFDDWLNFHLREVLPGNGVGNIVVSGDKTSFAIIDLEIYDSSLPGFRDDPVYDDGLVQGMSIGWADIYGGTLPDQWIDVTGVGPGRYWLEAEVDPLNRVVESDESNNVVRILVDLPSFVNPPNDKFTNAIELLGFSAADIGSNVGATKESGEPNHRPSNAGGASIWYRWTAPSDMNVVVSTEGSSADTVLAIYTGSSLNALSLIAWNDDSGIGATSLTNFTASSGVTYRIAVDGWKQGSSVSQGGIHLNINPAWNNDFNEAIQLSGMSGATSGSTRGATRQSGEPLHAGLNSFNSVWYSWTAPITGPFTFDTAGSSFDTILAVYTGSDFPLNPVASDDNSGLHNTSAVNFNAVADTTYHIVVDGVPGDLATGVFKLNWNGPRSPTIVSQPVATNNTAGSTVQFRVTVEGSAPFGYQWRHSGTNLVDDGAYFSGSTSPTLTLGKIFVMDAGPYTVVITNAYGTVTSTVANLIVLDNPRVVYVNHIAGPVGGTAVVPLQAQAVGDERTYKFSLSFDPEVLGNPRLEPGSDAPGATFVLNETLLADGKLGVILALPDGYVLPASSTLELARILLDANLDASSGTVTSIGFPPEPVSKTIISTTGANLTGLFAPGTLTLENWNAAASGMILPDGGFELSLTGPPNHTYVIEAATNLLSETWMSVSTNQTSATGLLQFVDPTASSSPQRFFRARMVQ